MAALPPGRWGEFLAGNPAARRVQFALIEQIRQSIAEFQPAVKGLIQQNIDTAEMGRRIGIAVVELEEHLPGKKLTEDFWRQMESVFNVNTGQSITRDMLVWFAKIARHHPDPITSIAEVRAVQKELLLATGDEQFQLVSERGQQVFHAPPNPLSMLKEQMSFSRWDGILKQLRADVNYCPGGRLRADLIPVLRVELGPVFKELDVLKKELGL